LKIYKNSWFDRFARKNNIEDKDLIIAVERAEKGLIYADLGGGLIKQRIARKGQSSAKGYRAIIIFKKEDKCFFVFGYSKSERDNISTGEEIEFKKVAKIMSGISEDKIRELLKDSSLIEVKRYD
jgi:hypothetical protein